MTISELCIFEVHICLLSLNRVVNTQYMCLPKSFLSLAVFTEPSVLSEVYLSAGRASAEAILSIYAVTFKGNKSLWTWKIMQFLKSYQHFSVMSGERNNL